MVINLQGRGSDDTCPLYIWNREGKTPSYTRALMGGVERWWLRGMAYRGEAVEMLRAIQRLRRWGRHVIRHLLARHHTSLRGWVVLWIHLLAIRLGHSKLYNIYHKPIKRGVTFSQNKRRQLVWLTFWGPSCSCDIWLARKLAGSMEPGMVPGSELGFTGDMAICGYIPIPTPIRAYILPATLIEIAG